MSYGLDFALDYDFCLYDPGVWHGQLLTSLVSRELRGAPRGLSWQSVTRLGPAQETC